MYDQAIVFRTTANFAGYTVLTQIVEKSVVLNQVSQ